MIHIENITKKFDSKIVLDGLSYTAKSGSICGIIGYNGAGKTTLLKIIAGIYRGDTGYVHINNENVYENESIKRSLFMVQDVPHFLPQSSITTMSKFYKGYYPNWSDDTCKKLAKIFNLNMESNINSFSKGMQRQAALLLGLSARPSYLLLDESFDGLDLSKRNLVSQILKEYIKTKGINIIISSHNLREVEDICDYIAIINGNKLSYSSSVHEMRKNKVKYKVSFTNKSNIEELKKYNIRVLSINDLTATLLFNEDYTEPLKTLTKLNPINIEIIPMTLEEIFLEESEDTIYDLQGLF